MIPRKVIGRKNKWLIHHRPNPQANLRLFCFPYAGGGASIYASWAEKLPDTIEVCPIQLPGRETRLPERPFTDLEPLVEAIADGIREYLDKPFAFFGHSMGALLSFELARYLQTWYGLTPVHLFLSGLGAPHLPPEEPPIHGLPEREFVGKLRELNGTPEEVLEHDELRELMLPVLRADFELCETYDYESAEPLNCPISVLGGLEDRFQSRDRLEGWRFYTSHSFRLRMLPGDHFFLHPHQSMILRVLARDLTESFKQAPARRIPEVRPWIYGENGRFTQPSAT